MPKAANAASPRLEINLGVDRKRELLALGALEVEPVAHVVKRLIDEEVARVRLDGRTKRAKRFEQLLGELVS